MVEKMLVETTTVEGHPQAHPVSCMTVARALQNSSNVQPSSGGGKDSSGMHFPTGSLDADARQDEFSRNWYSSHLAAMQEPPLYNAAVQDGAVIYRAVILPSFDPSYTIRIDRSADSITATTKDVTGWGGYAPGAMATSRSSRISDEAWKRLSEYVSAMWSSGGIISPARQRITLDGTQWVFEGLENGRYCVVNTHECSADENLARLMKLLHEVADRFTVDEARAEQRYKSDLATREETLGPEHPGVAHSLNDLAELYRARGRYAVAEPLYRRALAIREIAFGPEHPYTAASLENYAGLLRETGREDEAVEMEARARAIRARRAGTNPPG